MPVICEKLNLCLISSKPCDIKKEESFDSDQCKPYSLSPESRDRKIPNDLANKNIAKKAGELLDPSIPTNKEKDQNEEKSEFIKKSDKNQPANILEENNEENIIDDEFDPNSLLESEAKTQDKNQSSSLHEIKEENALASQKPSKTFDKLVANSMDDLSYDMRRTPGDSKLKLHSGSFSVKVKNVKSPQDMKKQQSVSILPGNSPSLKKNKSVCNKSEIFKSGRDKTEFFNQLVHVFLKYGYKK